MILFLTFGFVIQQEKLENFSYQKQINEDFNSFCLKFSKDRQFQTERILFPLPIFTENEQGESVVKKITRKSWKHTDFVGLKKMNKKSSIDIEINSRANAKLTYSMEDTGVSVIHFFIKKDGKWYLLIRE